MLSTKNARLKGDFIKSERFLSKIVVLTLLSRKAFLVVFTQEFRGLLVEGMKDWKCFLFPYIDNLFFCSVEDYVLYLYLVKTFYKVEEGLGELVLVVFEGVIEDPSCMSPAAHMRAILYLVEIGICSIRIIHQRSDEASQEPLDDTTLPASFSSSSSV